MVLIEQFRVPITLFFYSALCLLTVLKVQCSNTADGDHAGWMTALCVLMPEILP